MLQQEIFRPMNDHDDAWARICKRLKSSGIDSKEPIQPAGRRIQHWLAESIPGLLKRLQIRVLDVSETLLHGGMDSSL